MGPLSALAYAALPLCPPSKREAPQPVGPKRCDQPQEGDCRPGRRVTQQCGGLHSPTQQPGWTESPSSSTSQPKRLAARETGHRMLSPQDEGHAVSPIPGKRQGDTSCPQPNLSAEVGPVISALCLSTLPEAHKQLRDPNQAKAFVTPVQMQQLFPAGRWPGGGALLCPRLPALRALCRAGSTVNTCLSNRQTDLHSSPAQEP